MPALTCLKKLADKKVEAGITRLETLAGKKTEYAYLVAQLYEEGDEPEKAFFYYLLGMQRKRYLVHFLDIHPLSMEELITIGMRYFEGKERIQQNFMNAKICFRFASVKDCALADFYLGFMYQHGQGCQKKLVKALRYYHMAQDKGYFPAQEQLDNLLHSEALTADELVSLALSYEEGTLGLPKNELLARALYHKGARYNHPLAALHLGRFYQLDHVKLIYRQRSLGTLKH